MKIFPTKKDAINFLENSDNINYKLFQEDKDETNKKQYIYVVDVCTCFIMFFCKK